MRRILLVFLITLPSSVLTDDSERITEKVNRRISDFEELEKRGEFKTKPKDLTILSEMLAQDIVSLALFAPPTEETLQTLEKASEKVGNLNVTSKIMLPFEYFEHFKKIYSPDLPSAVGAYTIYDTRKMWNLIESAKITVLARATLDENEASFNKLFTHRFRELDLSK